MCCTNILRGCREYEEDNPDAGATAGGTGRDGKTYRSRLDMIRFCERRVHRLIRRMDFA